MKKLLLAATLLAASTAHSASVFVDGREWRQATETMGVAWSDVASQCDTITGACTGSYAGWKWASANDMAGLFEHYMTGTSPEMWSRNTQSYYSKAEFDSAWASSFMNDFNNTYDGLISTSVLGHIRNPFSYAHLSEVKDDWLWQGHYDVASIFNTFVDFSRPDMGAWLFKGEDYADQQLNETYIAPLQTPIPAAAFMFAPALLGFLGLRRKLK